MVKKIVPAIPEIVIGSCQDCRYRSYDGNYDRGHDSGYDCRNPNVDMSKVNVRIVDDWEIDNPNNKSPKGWPPIPEWCPLEDDWESVKG